jgi:hypothetical protein
MRLCIYDDLCETALCPVLLHLYVFSYFSPMFVIVYSYFHAYLVFILTRTALLTIPYIPYVLTCIFTVPKYVFFTDTYPKTASGKIQKFKLRELGTQLVKEGKGVDSSSGKKQREEGGSSRA